MLATGFRVLTTIIIQRDYLDTNIYSFCQYLYDFSRNGCLHVFSVCSVIVNKKCAQRLFIINIF